MKKLFLAFVATLTVSSVALAQTADQSTGSIVFKGVVTTSSCTLSPIEPVDLGSVSTRTLRAAGDASAWVSTNIEFVDCNLKTGAEDEGVQSVQLVIEPGTALNTDLWANTAGDATNVGLDLLINNQAVKPEGATLADIQIFNNETLTVPVRARMKASAAGVEAGSFNTSVKFTANYK
ncbi:type 1 fimbrial protein [Ignatzschineria rhizosphaerae]|uniref:Type 1 fimbrial protein n=1 Tax=Ignatzschineria rhizosphaerae TaxID=2923279 RepID=A0ABY3X1E7_9GAMM|nr:fimbrial protein [Ignatzschineria rhizosphaerae]UNM95710.1 type 1 fimbrial protein [Ignatzschineria rhizosphaerae]